MSGAGLVMLVSAILAVPSAWIPSRAGAWILALGVPLLIAYSLYWLPFWMGADDLEAGAWAELFIIPWYFAGAVVSSFVAFLVRIARS
jgi:hypothetical protein